MHNPWKVICSFGVNLPDHPDPIPTILKGPYSLLPATAPCLPFFDLFYNQVDCLEKTTANLSILIAYPAEKF